MPQVRLDLDSDTHQRLKAAVQAQGSSLRAWGATVARACVGDTDALQEILEYLPLDVPPRPVGGNAELALELAQDRVRVALQQLGEPLAEAEGEIAEAVRIGGPFLEAYVRRLVCGEVSG